MGRFSLARKLATSLLVAFLVGALAAAAVRLRPTPDPDGPSHRGASSLSSLDRLETGLFDALARREAVRRPASPDMVLVTIDEASVKRAREIAGGWPWTREYLGKLVVELRALGAKLVVLDTSFPDASRLASDDARFANELSGAGKVVAGFTFADAPEEGLLEPGRWAIGQGSYATRGAALLAAGPLLAEGARPYLVNASDRVEVWLGGYRDKAVAQKDAERLREAMGLSPHDTANLRELKAEETLDRVTVDVLFADRNAVPFSGGSAHELKTFQNLQAPVAELVASTVGFGNLRLEKDEDGVVRGVRHLWRFEGRYYPSLALAAAMVLKGRREVAIDGDRLVLGDLSVPVDEGGITRLRFLGRGEKEGAPDSPYPVVPVLAVVRSAERRAAGKSLDEKIAEKIAGKVVFVSFEVAECERAPTPIAPSSLRASAWATALDNLLHRDGLLRASADQDAAVAFSMALLGGLLSLLLTRGTRPWRTLFFEVGAASVLCLAFLTWIERTYRSGLWVAAGVPLLSFVLSLLFATVVNYADERMAASRIRDALGRHTMPGLVEALLRRPHHLRRAGDRQVLTTLVCRLDGFAQAMDSTKPKDLVRVLDEMLSDVSEAVTAHGGHIDRVVGATVVAYWGAPLPNERHALDGCRCALRLKDKLATRVAPWKERLGSEVVARISVCTGEMVVGNLSGARGRQRFAVFGPVMEAAERLVEQTVQLSTSLLIGEATFEAVKDEVGARELDLVRLPGRAYPLRLFELRSLKADQAEDDRAFCERFEQAVAAYRRREFNAALATFEALGKERPSDGPVALYVLRCKSYLAEPPGPEWDGVWEGASRH